MAAYKIICNSLQDIPDVSYFFTKFLTGTE